MSNVTKNQALAMKRLIESCCSNMGGKTLEDLKSDPFTWVEVTDLVEAGWTQKEAEGTFGSLVSSGHLFEAEHKMFALNEDWDMLSEFHV